MANFEDILSQQVDEVKVPPPMPVGTYIWTVQGLPTQGKSTKKQTDFVEFTCACLQALDDVDPEALEAFGAVAGKTKTLTFYVTEDAIFMLDRFLFEHLGIELGSNRKEAISMAPGRQFAGTIKHSNSEDGTRTYANINSTAAV